MLFVLYILAGIVPVASCDIHDTDIGIGAVLGVASETDLIATCTRPTRKPRDILEVFPRSFDQSNPWRCLSVPQAVCLGEIKAPFCYFAVEETFDQIWAPFKVTTTLVGVTVKRTRHVSVWADGSRHTRTELNTYGKGQAALTTPPPKLTWKTLGTTM
jgi:hypothetical protein